MINIINIFLTNIIIQETNEILELAIPCNDIIACFTLQSNLKFSTEIFGRQFQELLFCIHVTDTLRAGPKHPFSEVGNVARTCQLLNFYLKSEYLFFIQNMVF